jgi:hypothetical protein
MEHCYLRQWRLLDIVFRGQSLWCRVIRAYGASTVRLQRIIQRGRQKIHVASRMPAFFRLLPIFDIIYIMRNSIFTET